MRVNNRLLSFGYDKNKKSFQIRTTDPEYLKMLIAEDPMINEIIFELDPTFLKQIVKYYSLWLMKGGEQAEEFI